MTPGAAPKTVTQRPDEGARQRILDTAYELFSARGIRDVGIDELIRRADVAKATLYRHFPSKEELVLEFLRLHEDRWTFGRIQQEAMARGTTPEEQLLAVFDVFGEWFRESTFSGCSFAKALLEMGPEHNVGKACSGHIENIRAFVRDLARSAGLDDPTGFARSFTILTAGAAVQAVAGDTKAAKRAKEMARFLIAEHRPRAGRENPAAQDPATPRV